MKKIKKILLIVGITLLLAVIGVGSVSASAISLGKSNDSSFDFHDIFLKNEAEDYKDCTILAWLLSYSNSPVRIIYTQEFFEEYEEYFISSNDIDEAWNKVLSSSDVHTCDYNFSNEDKSTTFNDFINIYINMGHYGGYYLFEDDFKSHFVAQFSYYYEIKDLENVVTQKDTELTNLETSKNEEIAELNTTITEKNTAISNLESQNNKLEMNVAGLNSQVSALVEDRTELNAQIKSLENQMQLKINKAYAEGLADSDGEGNRVNKLISTLVIILTVVEVVALIAFIVSKARKNKHR